MKISVDQAGFKAGITAVEGGLDAVSETLWPGGWAEVMTSRRRKLPTERGRKVPGGNHIANFLRAKGLDPFVYDEAEVGEIQAAIGEEIGEAVEEAYRTGRTQRDRARRVLIAAAIDLLGATRRRILTGKLGQNSRYYRLRKLKLSRAGAISAQYGTPPPAGILTGRFIEGLRWRWHKGRRFIG